MPGSTGMDANLCVGISLCHLPRTSGVIEVDVRDDERRKIVHAELIESFDEVPKRGRRADLDKHAFRRVEQVARKTFRPALHPCIDRVQMITDLNDTYVTHAATLGLSLIHISEPTRRTPIS